MKTKTSFVCFTVIVLNDNIDDVKASLQEWFDVQQYPVSYQGIEVIPPTEDADHENVSMLEYAEEGIPIDLQDGGCLDFPDTDGIIRRRDVYGNCEEIREPGDDNYKEWLDLFKRIKNVEKD